jgi:hypothetical protein
MSDDYTEVYIVFDRQGVVSGVYRTQDDAKFAATHMAQVAYMDKRTDHFTVIEFELE